MFKESPEGSTHHFGDNCGEPAHNSSLNQLLDKTGEETLEKFLTELRMNVFIKSTNSVTFEEEKLNPEIEDQEAVIVIKGEWDREDLKRILRQSQIEAVKAFAEEIKKEIPGELSVLSKSIDKKLEELC
jgi:hypothetical protein